MGASVQQWWKERIKNNRTDKLNKNMLKNKINKKFYLPFFVYLYKIIYIRLYVVYAT